MEKFRNYKNKIIVKLQKGIQYLLENNRIELNQGEACFTSNSSLTVTDHSGKKNSYSFQHCIIATGSRTKEHPSISCGGRILSPAHALDLKFLPNEIAILGANHIGIELGCAFANLGVKVSIIEEKQDFLYDLDSDLRKNLKQQLKKRKIKLITNADLYECQEQDQKVRIRILVEGETLEVEADYLIVSTGRNPATNTLGLNHTTIEFNENGFIKVDSSLKTTVPSIFAIGDVIEGPAFAHRASYEGKLAAEVISGKNYAIDYKALPFVIFSDPEIALTGVTKSNDQIMETVFQMGANGRALTLNQQEGFVKIYNNKETGHIKCAAVIGPHASESTLVKALNLI
jgi:dihydrolipoamide dehydrogenase